MDLRGYYWKNMNCVFIATICSRIERKISGTARSMTGTIDLPNSSSTIGNRVLTNHNLDSGDPMDL